MDAKKKLSEAADLAIKFIASVRVKGADAKAQPSPTFDEVKFHILQLEREGFGPTEPPLKELLRIFDQFKNLLEVEIRQKELREIEQAAGRASSKDRKNDSGERTNEERNGERQ